jgi:hypothetical protein
MTGSFVNKTDSLSTGVLFPTTCECPEELYQVSKWFGILDIVQKVASAPMSG